MGGTSGITRFAVLLVLLALVLSACRLVPGRSRPSGVTVAAPGDGTQADRSGVVPVEIRLHPRIEPDTLELSLEPSRSRPIDLTDRLVVAGSRATLTLGPADRAGLDPGGALIDVCAGAPCTA